MIGFGQKIVFSTVFVVYLAINQFFAAASVKNLQQSQTSVQSTTRYQVDIPSTLFAKDSKDYCFLKGSKRRGEINQEIFSQFLTGGVVILIVVFVVIVFCVINLTFGAAKLSYSKCQKYLKEVLRSDFERLTTTIANRDLQNHFQLIS